MKAFFAILSLMAISSTMVMAQESSQRYCGEAAAKMSQSLGDAPVAFVGFTEESANVKYGFLEKMEIYRFSGKRSNLCTTFAVTASDKECRIGHQVHCAD